MQKLFNALKVFTEDPHLRNLLEHADDTNAVRQANAAIAAYTPPSKKKKERASR